MDFREDPEEPTITPFTAKDLAAEVDAAIGEASFMSIVNDHRQRTRLASLAAREAYDAFISVPGTVVQDALMAVTQMAFHFSYQTYQNDRQQGS